MNKMNKMNQTNQTNDYTENFPYKLIAMTLSGKQKGYKVIKNLNDLSNARAWFSNKKDAGLVIIKKSL